MKFILKEYLNSISYWFGKYDDEQFEFEPTIDDEHNFMEAVLKNYSKETLEEVLGKFIHEEYPDYDSLDLEEQMEAIKEVLFDHLDEFSDDAEEFFEADAYEQYKDSAEYEKDPYAYYGVNQRDFY